MEEKLFQEDITQLYDTLLHHPLLIDHPKLCQDFTMLYNSARSQCKDFHSFISASSHLTAFFHDGHTNIEIPYTAGDQCLAIPCSWRQDQLVLTKAFKTFPAETQIVAVENLPVSGILEKLAGRIPHENMYLVKSRTTEYPYRNYHLFSDLNLTWMFGSKHTYCVEFKNGQEHQTIPIPLTPYTGYLDFSDENFVSWKIQNNEAVLRLDACICNEAYEAALDRLAAECSNRNIETLTLDLSHNMGGSSEVIEKFIAYINIASFHRYEMIDYSSGKPITVCSRTEEVQNEVKTTHFPKTIYCKVGNTTFSSARTFAVTLKDNGLAMIVGEPTGGKPSSYGMPRKYTLQNTGIRFRVSRAWFGRPNAAFDSEDSLHPNL